MIDRGSIPRPSFSIVEAGTVRYAAVPTLRFTLHVDAGSGPPIRSILLDVQIQIAARRRGYSASEQALLQELFGAPERWSTTLRTVPWTRTTVVVAPFEDSTEAEVLVPCSYDLEVAGARYLSGLSDGSVPLEFLFSGSVFFTTQEGGLQTIRVASDCDAEYQLPVSVWREAMDRHFPDGAWLRVSRNRFEALVAYKARHACASWDAAVDSLLRAEETDDR